MDGSEVSEDSDSLVTAPGTSGSSRYVIASLSGPMLTPFSPEYTVDTIRFKFTDIT